MKLSIINTSLILALAMGFSSCQINEETADSATESKAVSDTEVDEEKQTDNETRKPYYHGDPADPEVESNPFVDPVEPVEPAIIEIYRWIEEYQNGKFDTLYGDKYDAKRAFKIDKPAWDKIDIHSFLHIEEGTPIQYDTIDYNFGENPIDSITQKKPLIENKEIAEDTIYHAIWSDQPIAKLDVKKYFDDSSKFEIIDGPETVGVYWTIPNGAYPGYSFSPCEKIKQDSIQFTQRPYVPYEGLPYFAIFDNSKEAKNYSVTIQISNKYGWSDTLRIHVNQTKRLAEACPE